MHVWNFTLKVSKTETMQCDTLRNRVDMLQIFYTLSSFYIIFLMTNVYARTREREKAWKFGLYCLLGSAVVAPFWYLTFKKWIAHRNPFLEVCAPTLHSTPSGKMDITNLSMF